MFRVKSWTSSSWLLNRLLPCTFILLCGSGSWGVEPGLSGPALPWPVSPSVLQWSGGGLSAVAFGAVVPAIPGCILSPGSG